MKKIVLTAAAILFAMLTFAQTDFKQGHITYTITVSGNNPMAQYINGSTWAWSVQDSMMRIDINNPMGQTIIIRNTKTKSGNMFMDMMSNKYVIPIKPDDYNADQQQWDNSYDVKYVDSTKVIGTHICKKAIVTLKKDKKEYTVWYDPAIVFNVPAKNMYKVNGLPVQFDLEQRGMVITNTLSSFDTKPVDSSLFKVSTDGYTTMSYDDYKAAMMGGQH